MRSSFCCAGGRIEIADLLQPQHQLEDVLDRDRFAHFRQADHAVFLGQPIGLALLGDQFERLVANQLRRQVLEHLVLRAAQE